MWLEVRNSFQNKRDGGLKQDLRVLRIAREKLNESYMCRVGVRFEPGLETLHTEREADVVPHPDELPEEHGGAVRLEALLPHPATTSHRADDWISKHDADKIVVLSIFDKLVARTSTS